MASSEFRNVAGSPDSSVADVVFVHGLHGHMHDTWLASPDCDWRAWLHADCPDICLWTYGYPAAFAGPSAGMPYLTLRATELLNKLTLRQFGCVENEHKPLVFVTHSLGGLLVKSLLRKAQLEKDDTDERRVLSRTRLVVFYATPHIGSTLPRWLLRLGALLNNNLRIFTLFNDQLDELREYFDKVREDSDIQAISFTENAKLFGIFRVTPPFAVGKHFPTGYNHFQICKIPIRDDDRYTALRRAVEEHIPTSSDDEIPSDYALLGVPEIPTTMEHRDMLHDALGGVLRAPMGENRRVVYGERGTGKTVQLAYFFRSILQPSFGEHAIWIDCRQHVDVPTNMPQLVTLRALVLDDARVDHPCLQPQFLSSLSQCIIIACTNNEQEATAIAGRLGCANCMIEVRPFTLDETTRFVERCVRTDSVAVISQYIHDMTKGLPVLLQLVSDLFVVDPKLRDPNSGLLSSDGSSQLEAVIERWLDSCIEPPDANVLSLLSAVPFFGLSESTIDAILGTKGRAKASLSFLLAKGVIRRSRSINGDVFYCAHDVIREQLSQRQDAVDTGWRSRYLAILRDEINSGEVEGLTAVDAWIVGWSTVFDEPESESDFTDRLSRHRKLLEQITQMSGDGFKSALRHIPTVLSSRFRDPSKERCDILIGIAHMVTEESVPRRSSIAHTIWLGALNPSEWARAASIAAAVCHWKECAGSAGRDEGIEQVKMWLHYALELWDRDSMTSAKQWYYENGLDYLAAVCGLLTLSARLDEVLGILESMEFRKRFKDLSLCELGVFAYCCECGYLTQHAESPVGLAVRRALSERWNRTQSDIIECTKARIVEYVTDAFRVNVSTLGLSAVVSPPAVTRTYALDIASQIGGTEMTERILNREENAVRHLPCTS